MFLKFTRQPNGQLKLVYKDNGPGVDAERKPLDSFGLTLISIQVEQLNGESTWQNVNGVVFTMIFPPDNRSFLKRTKKTLKPKHPLTQGIK
jgi:two-component sensor histidine kinase